MDKKYIVLTVLAALTMSAQAQQSGGTIAIGGGAVAQSVPFDGHPTGTTSAIAIGSDPNKALTTQASNGGIAMGIGAHAVGQVSSVSIGSYSNVTGTFGVCAGSNCSVTGANGSAIGAGTSVTNSNSGAFGNSSATTRDYEVSVGNEDLGMTRYVANVKAGEKDYDATNLYQVRAMNADTLAAANNYTDQRVYGLQSQIDDIKSGMRDVDRKIDGAKAMASAQSNIIYNPYGGRVQVGVGVGFTGSSSALAMKVMGTSSDRKQIYSVGVSAGSHGKPSFGGGATFSFN